MPYSILIYDLANTTVSDGYQKCDFSTKRFLHLQQGSNVIRVTHDGTNDLLFGVSARLEYESV